MKQFSPLFFLFIGIVGFGLLIKIYDAKAIVAFDSGMPRATTSPWNGSTRRVDSPSFTATSTNACYGVWNLLFNDTNPGGTYSVTSSHLGAWTLVTTSKQLTTKAQVNTVWVAFPTTTNVGEIAHLDIGSVTGVVGNSAIYCFTGASTTAGSVTSTHFSGTSADWVTTNTPQFANSILIGGVASDGGADGTIKPNSTLVGTAFNDGVISGKFRAMYITSSTTSTKPIQGWYSGNGTVRYNAVMVEVPSASATPAASSSPDTSPVFSVRWNGTVDVNFNVGLTIK